MFRWSFDTALKLQAGAKVTRSLAKPGDTVTRMRQAGTLSCCICVCAQLHLIYLISAEATYPTAAESISIRRGDNATTPATGQALTQCQTQLNEATALHQQCLASGPLTDAAAVPVPTLFLSMLCRSHWTITIDFKVGNRGIRT